MISVRYQAFGYMVLSVCAWLSVRAVPQECTLRQKIGHMLITGFVGRKPSDQGVACVARQIRQGELGGIILFRRNIESAEQLRHLIAYLKAQALSGDLLVAIDQEGGQVARIQEANVPSAKNIAAEMSLPQAYETYYHMGQVLAQIGFNVNCAPVVDLDYDPPSPIIGRYERSFSADPARVTLYAQAFIDAMHACGILTTLKHFPGHGSSCTDTHVSLTDITKTWQAQELVPYKELCGIDMIMAGHLTHSGLDSSGQPASISRVMLTHVLRQQLGFRGVIISDDMHMGAVQQLFAHANASLSSIVVNAIDAGIDILIFGNNPHALHADVIPPIPCDNMLAAAIVDAIEGAVQKGLITRERIEQSYERIQAMKNRIMI